MDKDNRWNPEDIFNAISKGGQSNDEQPEDDGIMNIADGHSLSELKSLMSSGSVDIMGSIAISAFVVANMCLQIIRDNNLVNDDQIKELSEEIREFIKEQFGI
jgi:hypothetical protein